jgi:hypothetical protein
MNRNPTPLILGVLAAGFSVAALVTPGTAAAHSAFATCAGDSIYFAGYEYHGGGTYHVSGEGAPVSFERQFEGIRPGGKALTITVKAPDWPTEVLHAGPCVETETTQPEETTPDTTQPEETVPEETVPETTVGETVPETAPTTVPDSTTPSGTSPETTVESPETTVPAVTATTVPLTTPDASETTVETAATPTTASANVPPVVAVSDNPPSAKPPLPATGTAETIRWTFWLAAAACAGGALLLLVVRRRPV